MEQAMATTTTRGAKGKAPEAPARVTMGSLLLQASYAAEGVGGAAEGEGSPSREDLTQGGRKPVLKVRGYLYKPNLH